MVLPHSQRMVRISPLFLCKFNSSSRLSLHANKYFRGCCQEDQARLFSGAQCQDKGQQTETETGNSVWIWWKPAFLRECVRDWNVTVNGLNIVTKDFFAPGDYTWPKRHNRSRVCCKRQWQTCLPQESHLGVPTLPEQVLIHWTLFWGTLTTKKIKEAQGRHQVPWNDDIFYLICPSVTIFLSHPSPHPCTFFYFLLSLCLYLICTLIQAEAFL